MGWRMRAETSGASDDGQQYHEPLFHHHDDISLVMTMSILKPIKRITTYYAAETSSTTSATSASHSTHYRTHLEDTLYSMHESRMALRRKQATEQEGTDRKSYSHAYG